MVLRAAYVCTFVTYECNVYTRTIQFTQLQYAAIPYEPHTQNTAQNIQLEQPHYLTHTYAYIFDHDSY